MQLKRRLLVQTCPPSPVVLTDTTPNMAMVGSLKGVWCEQIDCNVQVLERLVAPWNNGSTLAWHVRGPKFGPQLTWHVRGLGFNP